MPLSSSSSKTSSSKALGSICSKASLRCAKSEAKSVVEISDSSIAESRDVSKPSIIELEKESSSSP